MAWIADPVLNLQGVDPFDEQVNNEDPEENNDGQNHQDNVIEIPREENGDAEIIIEAGVAENVEDVRKENIEQDAEELEEVDSNPNQQGLVPAVFSSKLNLKDKRSNKRRRGEDVISDNMDMDKYSRETNMALHGFSEEVSKDKDKIMMKIGESYNGDIVDGATTLSRQGNTQDVVASCVDAETQVLQDNQETGNSAEQAAAGLPAHYKQKKKQELRILDGLRN